MEYPVEIVEVVEVVEVVELVEVEILRYLWGTLWK